MRLHQTVSIHACAGQATAREQRCTTERPVSIHACAGQATQRRDNPDIRGRFQSTPARGRRPPFRLSFILQASEFQSTPARGRRPHLLLQVFDLFSFNPRLRGAGDTVSILAGPPGDGFNPRLRGAGDVGKRAGKAGAGRFNPRLRGAGDLRYVVVVGGFVRFQSTPARGRRPRRVGQRCIATWVSIHACAGQATLRRVRLSHDEQVSIHACAGQATGCERASRRCYSFQSTPARGRRRVGISGASGMAQFQSTPARGRRRPTALRLSAS